jgi:Domain of unknown function (DUF4157)
MNPARQQMPSRPAPMLAPARSGLLQRKCACGSHTSGNSECAECGKKKLGLQRKLRVGASNDPLESEADRIAEQVMTTPAHPRVSSVARRIQRASGPSTGATETVPESVPVALVRGGRPLDAAVQQDMEQGFGHDFSQVRVHTGSAAERSARDLSAQAYTVGHDIVFGTGGFAPQTHEGRQLLAHELTHVVQQSRGSAKPIIQRRLLARGDNADIGAMLRLLESASGLTLKHDASNRVSITRLADRNPSSELAIRLWEIIDDPKQDAEIHLGRTQAAVQVGGFPTDLSKKHLVQEIRIDHVLALEKGAPGAGVGKLAHEIIENYEGHALKDYDWTSAFSASHEKAVKAENVIEAELGHPGARRAQFPVYMDPGKGKASFNRLIEDREQYFLVWDQSLAGTGTVSNARRAPRVHVSTYTIEGFTAGSDTLPKAAARTIAALTADMKNYPTASARVESYASVGASGQENDLQAYRWAEMVRDAVIDSTGDVIITNWRRFDLVSKSARTRNLVVVTVDRPDL